MQLDAKYLREFEELIGCDEVGRGPLAGPVVGCAVKIKSENKKLLKLLSEMGITDSKKVSVNKRRKILTELGIELSKIKPQIPIVVEYKGLRFEFAIGEHTPEEIDNLNILQASLSCMKNSASSLGPAPSCMVLVDGNKTFDLPQSVEAVIKGDQKFLCIGLASIIAKEFRDEKMKSLDLIYPGYGLAKHAGYPTAEHREAISRLGVSPAHRKSFKGVKEYVVESSKGMGEGEEDILTLQ